jgi:hypothetical protein
VAVSPDGRSVYVVNRDSDNISQFDAAAGGALSRKSPATAPAGNFPTGIAVTPLARVPTTKDQCKNGGHRQFGFRNQGQYRVREPRTEPLTARGYAPRTLTVCRSARLTPPASSRILGRAH